MNTTRTNSFAFDYISKLFFLVQNIFVYIKVTCCSRPVENIFIAVSEKNEELVEMSSDDVYELERVDEIEELRVNKNYEDNKLFLEGKKEELVKNKRTVKVKKLIEVNDILSNKQKENVKNRKVAKGKKVDEQQNFDCNRRVFTNKGLPKNNRKKISPESEDSSSNSQKPLKDNKTVKEHNISYLFTNNEYLFYGWIDYGTRDLCLHILNRFPKGNISYVFESEGVYNIGYTDEDTFNACYHILRYAGESYKTRK